MQVEHEKVKADLQKEQDKIKLELDKIKFEYETKYSKLHEERGQIIKKLYKGLIDLETSLKSLTSLAQGSEWISDNSREENAKEKLKFINDEIEYNRIYLPEGLCREIEKIAEEYNNIISEMRRAKNQEKTSRRLQESQDERPFFPETSTQKWIKAEEAVNNELKKTKFYLVEQFRKIIGVE
jgi:hypothetical protein